MPRQLRTTTIFLPFFALSLLVCRAPLHPVVFSFRFAFPPFPTLRPAVRPRMHTRSNVSLLLHRTFSLLLRRGTIARNANRNFAAYRGLPLGRQLPFRLYTYYTLPCSWDTCRGCVVTSCREPPRCTDPGGGFDVFLPVNVAFLDCQPVMYHGPLAAREISLIRRCLSFW